jgi:hypothetical protein
MAKKARKTNLCAAGQVMASDGAATASNQQKVEVLTHRYSSTRTKNRSQFDEGALADAELVKNWDIEDLVDPCVQTVTPTTRTMANDIQENAFHAYFEDWEEALLTTSEAGDSTARFGLATKYMRMVMFDAEMGEWRVVVDLEWISKRAYGNEKGWVLVASLCQAATISRLQPQ